MSPLFTVFAALVVGCSPGAPATGCVSGADCVAGQACVDGRCVEREDASVGVDAEGCVCAAGESCESGSCRPDCGDPRVTPCEVETTCDFASGTCVPDGTAALSGSGETCTPTGAQCLPGTECSLAGACEPAPPCASMRCVPDGSTCWGASCVTTRPVAACTPAPLERMMMPDFLRGGDNGITDLELDDACNAYAVTVISGVDHFRELHPDGTLVQTDGVTNLNMGEVAVLRPYDDEFGTDPGEVALTYTCCLTCGCLAAEPQGVAHFDRATSMLPMVIVATPSTGAGPFGTPVIDSGPYGLTWGRDRTVYVGNVNADGDLVRGDLATGSSSEVRRFAARIHATASYDRTSLLVATAGGAIARVSTDGTLEAPFADMGQDVTSLVRDPFLARVYVSVRDGRLLALDLDGMQVDELLPAGGAGRVAYSPDGALYYLRTGWLVPLSIERVVLPSTL